MSACVKGKGKGKGKSPEGGKGHTLPRTRLSAEKFTGTVVAWKGKFGWVKPAEDIEHEKASLRGGNLFVGMDDIEGAEGLEEGASVEFHVWEDESGLGADEVVQTSAGEAQPKGKSSWNGGAKGAKGAKGAWGGAWGGGKADAWGGVSGGVKGGAGKAAKGATKGWALTAGPTPVQTGYGKADAKGKMTDKGKGKGDGKGKGKSGGKGHLLPRTRVSAEKFTGTVSAWKGMYGWITPAEEIGHEKAGKHGGGVFVSKDDIQGAEELTPGSVVEFHIWEDSSGLGAEEVVIQS